MLHALQVGSKNAAFFMGKCIKIATRSTGSDFVHELGIAAADLEERYKAHGASITSLILQVYHEKEAVTSTHNVFFLLWTGVNTAAPHDLKCGDLRLEVLPQA